MRVIEVIIDVWNSERFFFFIYGIANSIAGLQVVRRPDGYLGMVSKQT